jgi:hypothetical protein
MHIWRGTPDSQRSQNQKPTGKANVSEINSCYLKKRRVKMNIKPPKELSKSSKEFFNSIVDQYEMEPHHIQLLIQASECLDRIKEAREVIEKEGAYYLDRFHKPKAHPAVETEAKFKVVFKNLLKEIGLDIEISRGPGRPPEY